MKKITSTLITITLIMLLITSSYANDSDVIASLSNETAQPGETITLTVNIAQTDDGIAGLQGKIVWDTNQLTYIDSQVGRDFTTLNFNDDETSDALGTFSVYGNEYVTTGGTAFTVTFEVNSELAEETQINIGVTGIKAEYQTAGTVDIQDKELGLSIVNGSTTEEEPKPDENTNSTNQTPANTITNTTVANAVVDNTTANKVLPDAGVTVVILSVILILLIVLIVSGKNYIQYLKDTRKQLK